METTPMPSQPLNAGLAPSVTAHAPAIAQGSQQVTLAHATGALMTASVLRNGEQAQVALASATKGTAALLQRASLKRVQNKTKRARKFAALKNMCARRVH